MVIGRCSGRLGVGSVNQIGLATGFGAELNLDIALPRTKAELTLFMAVSVNAGIWEDTPKPNAAFREKYRKQIDAQAKKRKAEEMI